MAKRSKNIFEYELTSEELVKGLQISINRTYIGLIIIFLIQVFFFTKTPEQKQTVVLAIAGATLTFYIMGRWAQQRLYRLLPIRVSLTAQTLVLEYLRAPFFSFGAKQREWIQIPVEQITAIEPGTRPLMFLMYSSEIIPSYYVKTVERQYSVFFSEQATKFAQALEQISKS